MIPLPLELEAQLAERRRVLEEIGAEHPAERDRTGN